MQPHDGETLKGVYDSYRYNFADIVFYIYDDTKITETQKAYYYHYYCIFLQIIYSEILCTTRQHGILIFKRNAKLF